MKVTNVDEPGTVTLSTLQPQVGQGISDTLTLTRTPYVTITALPGSGTGAVAPSRARPTPWARYMSCDTPTPRDVGSVLRATAMYDDEEDEDKTAQEVFV